MVLASEASLIPKPIEEFIQKHNKKEKHHRTSVPTVVNELSTGTVIKSSDSADKSLQNGSHPDYDCNDIMAKALVRASEEKEVAFLERDNALLEAKNAKVRAEELDQVATKALEDADRINIEYELMKKETDNRLKEMKTQTEMEIEKVMTEMKEELSLKEKEWSEEKIRILQTVEEKLEEYENEKEKSVSTLMQSYGEEMEHMKQTYESQIFMLKDELEKTQVSFTEYKDFVKKKMKSAEEKFHQDVEYVKKGYEKEIMMMKDHVETMKVALKVREEANIAGSLKHQEETTELENQVMKLKQQLDVVKEEVIYWTNLHDQQGYFNMTLIQKDTLILLRKALDSLKKGSAGITTKASIKFRRICCTATMESKTTFSQLLQNSKLLWSKVNVLTKPQQEVVLSLYDQHLATHVDTMTTTVQSFYNQHLASIIEGSMMEANSFHNNWVKPFYHDLIKPMKEKLENEYIIPGRMKTFLWMHKVQRSLGEKTIHSKDKFVGLAEVVFERTCYGVEKLSSDFLRWLQRKPYTHPIIVSSIQWVSSHSEFFVQLVVTLLCAFCIYKLRRVLFSMSVCVVLAPFRFLWYVSPLSLLTSKEDEDEEGIIGRKLDSDSSFVVSVKDNGSPIPKKASSKK